MNRIAPLALYQPIAEKVKAPFLTAPLALPLTTHFASPPLISLKIITLDGAYTFRMAGVWTIWMRTPLVLPDKIPTHLLFFIGSI